MEPISDFSKVSLHKDNVMIPQERLRSTPSSEDGCPEDLEMDLRIAGCDQILKAGLMLKLPQVAMSTAQVLFHRFFYARSFVKHSLLNVVMACIFLAAKLEDSERLTIEVVSVFHHMRQKKSGIGKYMQVKTKYTAEESEKLKSIIHNYEFFVLRDLGFIVNVRTPHKILFDYLNRLNLDRNADMIKMTWCYLNDSFRTNIAVRFMPETIACASILLASRFLNIPLSKKPPWWTKFDVNFEDMQTVYMEVLNLQSRPKYSLIDLEKRLTVVKQEFIKKSSKATTIIDSSTGSIPSSSTSTRSSVAQSQASATSEIKTSEIKASASSDPSSLTASFKISTQSKPISSETSLPLMSKNPANTRIRHCGLQLDSAPNVMSKSKQQSCVHNMQKNVPATDTSLGKRKRQIYNEEEGCPIGYKYIKTGHGDVDGVECKQDQGLASISILGKRECSNTECKPNLIILTHQPHVKRIKVDPTCIQNSTSKPNVYWQSINAMKNGHARN